MIDFKLRDGINLENWASGVEAAMQPFATNRFPLLSLP